MDELRRGYHDRIADLRHRSGQLVGTAAAALEGVTGALLERDRDAAQRVVAELAGAGDEVAAMEAEVLEVIALQAPVARDLRLILTSLFIAQVAELCIGLERTLAARNVDAEDVLTPGLRALVSQIGAETVVLLRRAAGAWAVLDDREAAAVIEEASVSRALQRRFLGELMHLDGVSVEAAVDLGTAARAYERLTDHAVEIAARVIFAATGAPPDPAVIAGP